MNDDDAFILEKVSIEEKSDIFFVNSAIQKLYYLRQSIFAKETKFFDKSFIDSINEILKSLILWIFEDEKQHTLEQVLETDGIYIHDLMFFNFFKIGLPLQNRQRLLKDMKLIDLLTDILYFPFSLGLIKFDEDYSEDIRLLFKLCYALIKNTIKEYRPNEIYASQWLELMMDHTVKSSIINDINAEPTLTELIDNNRKILESKIKKETIAKFMNILDEKGADERFINLLRALCTCDGEAMMANQAEIGRHLLQNKEISDKLIYPIRDNNDTVEVYLAPIKCWTRLTDLKAMLSKADNMQLYDYFIGMINLLSDLCLGRNYIAIEQLEKVFTLDIIMKIIANDDLEKKLRCVFCRLLIHLWIDRKPYSELNVPNYLLIWEEINEDTSHSVLIADTNFDQFDDLKKFIMMNMKKIASFGYLKAYDRESNEFTLALLKILRILMKFGLSGDIGNLIDLLPDLIILLNGMKDIIEQEEESNDSN